MRTNWIQGNQAWNDSHYQNEVSFMESERLMILVREIMQEIPQMAFCIYDARYMQ